MAQAPLQRGAFCINIIGGEPDTDIYGKHFKYAGTLSRTYDLMVTAVSSSIMDSLYGTEENQYFYGRKARKNYLLETVRDDSPLKFSVDITRREPFSQSDLRDVEQWLFGQGGFRKFYVDPDDDFNNENVEIINDEPKYLYLNCIFTNPTKLIYNGGVIGFNCTMECDSGYVWQDAVTYTFSGESQFSLDVNSDITGYIYPRVTIVTGNGESNVRITNYTDDSTRVTRIESVPSNTTLILDGSINYFSNASLYDNFTWHHFIRLLRGSNSIRSLGIVSSLSFTWSNARYW